MSDYGWYRKDDKLKILWETQQNMDKVEELVSYLTKGCKCKTGCTTRRCKCKKGSLQCGPSCQCMNCHNTDISTTVDEEVIHEILHEIDGDEYYDFEDEKIESEEFADDHFIDELMEDVFGECSVWDESLLEDANSID
jgi:hypothetical protein